MVGWEAPSPEERQEGLQEEEESREVEYVGPEEDPARWASTQWKTEEPLKRGFAPPPEPPRVADLGGGGEEDAEEDGEGDEGHEERVHSRDGAQRNGSPPREEEAEEEVEGEREEDVDRDGGEEERPRGAPRLAGAPSEAYDGWVLRQVVDNYPLELDYSHPHQRRRLPTNSNQILNTNKSNLRNPEKDGKRVGRIKEEFCFG